MESVAAFYGRVGDAIKNTKYEDDDGNRCTCNDYLLTSKRTSPLHTLPLLSSIATTCLQECCTMCPLCASGLLGPNNRQ